MSNEINTEKSTAVKPVADTQDQVNTRELQKPESGGVYDGLKDSVLGNLTMSEYKNSLGAMLNGSSHLPEASINKKDGTIDFSVSSDEQPRGLSRAGKADVNSAPNMVTDKPNKVDNPVYRLGDDGTLSLVNKQGNDANFKRPNKVEDGAKKPGKDDDLTLPNKVEDAGLDGKKPIQGDNSKLPNKTEDDVSTSKKPIKDENSERSNKAEDGEGSSEKLDKGGFVMPQDRAGKDELPNKDDQSDRAKKTKPAGPKPIDGLDIPARRLPRAERLGSESVLERARELRDQRSKPEGKDPNHLRNVMPKPGETDRPNVRNVEPDNNPVRLDDSVRPVKPQDFVKPETQPLHVLKQPNKDIFDGPAKRKYPLPGTTRDYR